MRFSLICKRHHRDLEVADGLPRLVEDEDLLGTWEIDLSNMTCPEWDETCQEEWEAIPT